MDFAGSWELSTWDLVIIEHRKVMHSFIKPLRSHSPRGNESFLPNMERFRKIEAHGDSCCAGRIQ